MFTKFCYLYLINHMGLRKINTRGIEQANKVMLMAATAYITIIKST